MKIRLLNFVGDPGVPFLNFEGDPGVPLLNFRGFPGPTFKFEGGPGVLVPLVHHAKRSEVIYIDYYLLLLHTNYRDI